MNRNFKVRLIKYKTKDYFDAVRLRSAVLRTPLGLSFSRDELDSESDSFHFGCYMKKQLLGCLILKPINVTTIRMRQVAVDPRVRGHGIGRLFVESSERFAIENGFKLIILHARETAVPFYEKLNYVKRGERFIEVTIPHWEMVKKLY